MIRNFFTDRLLEAYREGIFPMAESADDPRFDFYRPATRALLPIKELHIPRRLLKTVKQGKFRISVDEDFSRVIDGCAENRDNRPSTWINKPIRDLFLALHKEGHAHSIECWDADNNFAGGVYGAAIGAVFCGESMVSYQTDASKVALVHLCARLYSGGFTLLDSQFYNPHLVQFGLYEMPQEEYEERIKVEMQKSADFLQAGMGQQVMLDAYLTHKIKGQ